MINQNKGKVNGGLLIKYTLAMYRTFKKMAFMNCHKLAGSVESTTLWSASSVQMAAKASTIWNRLVIYTPEG